MSRMLERQLQYTFKDPGLAREACTHCSFPDPTCPSYQRLEFLGDAVIDLGVSRFFDSHYRYRLHVVDALQTAPWDGSSQEGLSQGHMRAGSCCQGTCMGTSWSTSTSVAANDMALTATAGPANVLETSIQQSGCAPDMARCIQELDPWADA